MRTVDTRVKRVLDADPYLTPYADTIRRRLELIDAAVARLTQGRRSLADFASGHEYFGLHFRDGEWVFREWAPNATAMHLVGDMTGWQVRQDYALDRVDDGAWERYLPADRLTHGALYRLRVRWPGGGGDRIPAYARRVVQDPRTLIFNAQVWRPSEPFRWNHHPFTRSDEPPLIYEAHVGMAQDAEGIGSYEDFTRNVLPRVVTAGYNTLQLMAIQEHPLYASFGYQVSSFYAPSSRFGTPDALKSLIDTAHRDGVAVIMDVIHSHAVANEVEGLSRFDGTLTQYFHAGPRGRHPAWDSRCFDYGKPQVLHFLLSNCRYWLDEYRFDGFRFDGITSMLYLDHGLGRYFTSYDDYYGDNVDEDALTYLALANLVIHAVRPDAVTIAEDVSGMPGLASARSAGGVGFDYRFAMGVPDYWIQLVKETRDEDWPLGNLWFELTNRRREEKTISYVESHDQALVGDQTLIFRLIGAAMYEHMQFDDDSLPVARGVALHKMIRLLTLATAAHGYLNFMGNEFGHPEWIDFPREGNSWSYKYARRQWHLVDDDTLKYRLLARFDRDMIALARRHRIFESSTLRLLHEHAGDKVLVFERAGLVFAFNLHPRHSLPDYQIAAPPGKYRMILDSDARIYGGHGRLHAAQRHFTRVAASRPEPRHTLSLYLPSRSAIVLGPDVAEA